MTDIATGSDTTTAAVGGFVAAGFEPVRDLFASCLPDLGDGGGAYAAYHRGSLVVDLWAGDAGGGPWGQDTTALFMSTTKAVAAFCVQMLHERGTLDVFAPVATYWPDFAQGGKQDVTVAQVLTHTSGVVGSAELTELMSPPNGPVHAREPDIADVLARATPYWAPGTQAGYHTCTFSWLVNEVVRGADGRDIGTFFREEVALPLGCDDLWIGTPVEHHDRIATVLPWMWPAGMPDEVRGYMEWFLASCRDETSAAGVSCFAKDGIGVLDRLPDVFNHPVPRTVPLAASNMCGTARSAARVFAAIGEPDGLDGVRLSSPDALALFSREHENRLDVVMGVPMSRGLGYNRNKPLVPRPQTMGPNEDAVGHSGAGGQIGFADPVARVGAVLVRSHYTAFPVLPMLLNNALYACLPA